jgi:hypothetical protein
MGDCDAPFAASGERLPGAAPGDPAAEIVHGLCLCERQHPDRSSLLAWAV